MNKQKATLYDLIKQDIKEKYKSSIKKPIINTLQTAKKITEPSTLKVLGAYVTGTIKSVAIGWLPSDVRFKAEEKVLNDLEKKILYKGTVLINYNFTSIPGGTRVYKTGDISAIVNGVAFGTYLTKTMLSNANTPDEQLMAYIVGATATFVSIISRYLINAENSGSIRDIDREQRLQIKERNIQIKEYVPVAGNMFTALPISLAVKSYTRIKQYFTAKKDQIEELNTTKNTN